MKEEHALYSIDALIKHGLVSADLRHPLSKVADRYAIAVTTSMADLIDPNNPNDPIGLQFLPQEAELVTVQGEDPDPIGDVAHSPVEGIIHRYKDRVLLKLLHICPVYCRFCFRRETVGPQGAGTLGPDAIGAALNYIRDHDEIWEVILTGGDPLALSPRRLKDVMSALSQIDHVRIVRFHTRVPAVDPSRINEALVEALKASGKTIYIALHANHPRELTPAARIAIARLVDAGFAMVSQTVLLRGINDDIETLTMLMRSFVENRIKPYYLHHGDLAPGTSHFRVDIERGQNLVRALLGRVSGLCQPSYVLDIPGGHGKSPIGPAYLERNATQDYEVTDFNGRAHGYRDITLREPT